MGRFTAATASANCLDCAAGSFQDLRGQIACKPCAYGRFKKLAGPQNCSDCPAGSYTSAETTLFACASCAPGRRQALAGQVNCTLCASGRFVAAGGSTESSCTACALGRVVPVRGAFSCQECASPTTFVAQTGQATCAACPAHAVAAGNHTTCECDAGFIAIPFGQEQIFRELDLAAYDTYQAAVQAAGNGTDDVNAQLGFWCGACPEGADCRRPGTTLATVRALEGFFAGLDGTNTTFVACLNAACGEGGACKDGYTGSRPCCCSVSLLFADVVLLSFSSPRMWVIWPPSLCAVPVFGSFTSRVS